MGMYVQSSGGRGRRRTRRAMAEINVTPMVDVMLVLLVIFMVTAPMLTAGYDVDLPDAKGDITNKAEKFAVVSVLADGSLRLTNETGQESIVTADTMVARLQDIQQRIPTVRIAVMGDEKVPYGTLMEIMGTLYQAGYPKVSLITDPNG
jgi:biopolymer transport protein TolR